MPRPKKSVGSDADEFDPDFVPLPLHAVPSVVWKISPALLIAVDTVLGDPVDTYVNGSQVWIDEDGPIAVEWRLHPIAGYKRPTGMTSSAVFPAAVEAAAERAARTKTAGVSDDGPDSGSDAGSGPVLDPAALWDGLEAFPAYHDPIDVDALHEWSVAKIGLAADAFGLVNHDVIADRWERSGRSTSIIGDLLHQLSAEL